MKNEQDGSHPSENLFPAFRHVPKTGVIFVNAAAKGHGYEDDPASWVNLGQGRPEIGPMAGAPDRLDDLDMPIGDHEYPPVAGIRELRRAVADYYNRFYRQGMPSQYTEDNVCIAPGGRAALTRAIAALGHINLGHFLPDYTAYEELLDAFQRFSPIPILLEPEDGFRISTGSLRKEILGRGLSALLFSNPCNPTGRVTAGDTLTQWLDMSRELNCAMLIDEFYSHFVWSKNEWVSAARYVEDVNRDPVIMVNGLTKNWRYPGWRVAWCVGPKQVIESVSSAGSFLDGGGARPMQRAAISILDPEKTQAEAAAVRDVFLQKRDLMVDGLRLIGMKVPQKPEGTFYCWVDLSNLPESINTGHRFFQAALKKKLICVPGDFFDINPGQRRFGRPSRFRHYLRLSFGPEQAVIEDGLARLGEIVRDAQRS